MVVVACVFLIFRIGFVGRQCRQSKGTARVIKGLREAQISDVAWAGGFRLPSSALLGTPVVETMTRLVFNWGFKALRYSWGTTYRLRGFKLLLERSNP